MLARVGSMYIPSSISHSGHSEAAARCSEPSFFLSIVSMAEAMVITSITCMRCSHFWTLQAGAQMGFVLKQALQVAAVLAQIVTCGLTLSPLTEELDSETILRCRDRSSVLSAASKDGMNCGDNEAIASLGLASILITRVHMGH